jgi:hypothetical protein
MGVCMIAACLFAAAAAAAAICSRLQSAKSPCRRACTRPPALNLPCFLHCSHPIKDAQGFSDQIANRVRRRRQKDASKTKVGVLALHA